jgi:tetratricopeptide (TPR) repeat protein
MSAAALAGEAGRPGWVDDNGSASASPFRRFVLSVTRMDEMQRKAALGRAAALLAEDPSAAEDEARRVVIAVPSDPNALLILGSAFRRQGKSREAIVALNGLLRVFPRAAPAQYEFGMALADAGETQRAMAAFQKAVELDTSFADAWRALGALMFEAGETRAAERAYDHYHLAMVRDAKLRPAAVALYSGRPDEAERVLAPLLAEDTDNVAGHALLGEALTRLGRPIEAAAALERALQLDPAVHETRFRLARAFSQQGRAADAIPHLEQLLAVEPANAGYLNLMALVVGLTDDFDRSVAFYEQLLARYDQIPKAWTHYGHALRIVGRGEDAAAAYRRATALEPAYTDAYLGLANLKVIPFSDAEVAAMRQLKDRPDMPAADRAQLAFALGEALEDRNQHETAFGFYAEGSSLVRGELGYDAEASEELIKRSIAVFDAPFFAERPGYGAGAPDPIFIVGLPRSGSTLIEQILASHPSVEATFELPVIGMLATQMSGYPESAGNLTAEEARGCGEEYLLKTEQVRRLGRPFFVDKMPTNFQFVGLIQLILPNAKIIDARRHPMAACFSSFKQKFAEGGGFSYDLADLGRFYRGYLELMRHFDRVLPGKTHRVIYEDLVADTETEVRRLLDYLGLEFDPACLEFHQTQRAIRTVSSEQVRRPIYREGLDHWRKFEPWLEPLKVALGPALDSWRS